MTRPINLRGARSDDQKRNGSRRHVAAPRVAGAGYRAAGRAKLEKSGRTKQLTHPQGATAPRRQRREVGERGLERPPRAPDPDPLLLDNIAAPDNLDSSTYKWQRISHSAPHRPFSNFHAHLGDSTLHSLTLTSRGSYGSWWEPGEKLSRDTAGTIDE